MSSPASGADRVKKARARQIAFGWRRIPYMIPPAAADALDVLIARGYADSITGVVARALIEATKRSQN